MPIAASSLSRPRTRRTRRPARVTVPSAPVGVSDVRSTPRSLASLRTGGFASTRTCGSAPAEVPAPRARPGSGLGGALPLRVGDDRRDAVHGLVLLGDVLVERVVDVAARCTRRPPRDRLAARAGSEPRSALIRPTSDSPSPPPLAAGLDRSISVSCRRGRAGAGAGAAGSPIAMIGVPTGDGLALGHQQRGHGAGVRRRQLDQRLGGLDLDDDVVDRDHVADLDLPGHDLGLGEALADVGQQVLGHGQITPSRSRVAVDGVEHPVEVGEEVLLDPRRRVGGVEAADPQHRRLQGVEALLGDPGRDLGAHAQVDVRLVGDDRAAGAAYGLVDRRHVERRERAQVDHLERPALAGRGLGGRRQVFTIGP